MKILCIVGTRPEAIKMAPVITALRRHGGAEIRVCTTGQHREMLDQTLRVFDISPDHDLDVMRPGQALNGLTGRVLAGVDHLLASTAPDRVLVHGDTTTAMAAAMAAFHRRIAVGHVEAGLRTHDLSAPWPEEFNRRTIDLVSDLLFAPTAAAASNLTDERVAGRVLVTGNTVVDSLDSMVTRLLRDTPFRSQVRRGAPPLRADRPLLLVTCHRREIFGSGLQAIADALETLAADDAMEIVLPVHRNPEVRRVLHARLDGRRGLHLIEPVDYPGFVDLLMRAAVVLTDSGGVQEEAASLGRPLLIMREATERPEALRTSDAVLVGVDSTRIVGAVRRALRRARDDQAAPVLRRTLYGDGRAADRIVDAVFDRPVSEFGAHKLTLAV